MLWMLLPVVIENLSLGIVDAEKLATDRYSYVTGGMLSNTLRSAGHRRQSPHEMVLKIQHEDIKMCAHLKRECVGSIHFEHLLATAGTSVRACGLRLRAGRLGRDLILQEKKTLVRAFH